MDKHLCCDNRQVYRMIIGNERMCENFTDGKGILGPILGNVSKCSENFTSGKGITLRVVKILAVFSLKRNRGIKKNLYEW